MGISSILAKSCNPSRAIQRSSRGRGGMAGESFEGNATRPRMFITLRCFYRGGNSLAIPVSPANLLWNQTNLRFWEFVPGVSMTSVRLHPTVPPGDGFPGGPGPGTAPASPQWPFCLGVLPKRRPVGVQQNPRHRATLVRASAGLCCQSETCSRLHSLLGRGPALSKRPQRPRSPRHIQRH